MYFLKVEMTKRVSCELIYLVMYVEQIHLLYIFKVAIAHGNQLELLEPVLINGEYSSWRPLLQLELDSCIRSIQWGSSGEIFILKDGQFDIYQKTGDYVLSMAFTFVRRIALPFNYENFLISPSSKFISFWSLKDDEMDIFFINYASIINKGVEVIQPGTPMYSRRLLHLAAVEIFWSKITCEDCDFLCINDTKAFHLFHISLHEDQIDMQKILYSQHGSKAIREISSAISENISEDAFNLHVLNDVGSIIQVDLGNYLYDSQIIYLPQIIQQEYQHRRPREIIIGPRGTIYSVDHKNSEISCFSLTGALKETKKYIGADFEEKFTLFLTALPHSAVAICKESAVLISDNKVQVGKITGGRIYHEGGNTDIINYFDKSSLNSRLGGKNPFPLSAIFNKPDGVVFTGISEEHRFAIDRVSKSESLPLFPTGSCKVACYEGGALNNDGSILYLTSDNCKWYLFTVYPNAFTNDGISNIHLATYCRKPLHFRYTTEGHIAVATSEEIQIFKRCLDESGDACWGRGTSIEWPKVMLPLLEGSQLSFLVDQDATLWISIGSVFSSVKLDCEVRRPCLPLAIQKRRKANMAILSTEEINGCDEYASKYINSLALDETISLIQDVHFVCAFLSETQNQIMSHIGGDDSKTNLLYEKFCRYGYAYWVKDCQILRGIVELVARSEYRNGNMTMASLLYALLGKKVVLKGIWKNNAGPEKKLLDLLIENPSLVSLATKNAYSAISKQKYLLAILVLLLVDKNSEAFAISYDRMHDNHLACLIARFCVGKQAICNDQLIWYRGCHRLQCRYWVSIRFENSGTTLFFKNSDIGIYRGKISLIQLNTCLALSRKVQE